MCGVFGVLWHKPAARADERSLARVVPLLEHRGPDSSGVFADERVGLVHTRLALVDLDARSNQPFWDASRRYGLVFNGEIYNFRELRRELEADGVAFRTSSDTEVLLEAIIHRGLDATLLRLEGMFAFAMYDRETGSLTLARDRFGIKPLFIHEDGNAFLFASNVRALGTWVRLEPDRFSISSYLHGFGGPTSGRSFFSNVVIVPPGTIVVARSGCRSVQRHFWTMADFWEPDEIARLKALKPNRLVDLVEEQLFESVKKQLVADAPVGTLCSGGVDSAVVTAMAARLHDSLAVFHANVVGPDTSEFQAARQVAEHLKLDLKSVDVGERDNLDLLVDVMLHYAHPFTYHPNSVPFLMVSRLVREHRVKAVLSGEGADECFVGYPWLIFNLREFLLGSPANVRAVFQQVRRGIEWARGRAVNGRHERSATSIAGGLLNGFDEDLDRENVHSVLEQRIGRTPTDRETVTLLQLGYHLRTLLHRNDCLGMAASIEARFPFLDTAVVRAAVNMPYAAKVRFAPARLDGNHWFLQDKWVLRKIAERYLPRSLAYRKKAGFVAHPVYERAHIPGAFTNGSFVIELLALNRRQADHLRMSAGPDLWMRLLHLEIWLRLFIVGERPDDVRTWLARSVNWRA